MGYYYIWFLIPLVAIIDGYIIDYQTNKLKWQSKNASNENEIEEVRALVQKLKKRISNLEAIAVHSDEYGSESNAKRIEYNDHSDQIKRENEKTVSKSAKMRGN